MGFWKNLTQLGEEKKQSASRLHDKLLARFPDTSESELLELSCIAGLLSRVAHADMKLTGEEKTKFAECLTHWTDLSQETIEKIVQLALEEIQDLAGLENHLYTAPLRENFSTEKRYQVLEALFELAASDGRCDNVESEEIRTICTGLGLHHQEFIAARATVHEKLTALLR
jgi:uncharacterized tellurite resistance protein B-like protein